MKNRADIVPGARIAIGMSGGVDSSVAAALLQKQGFIPVGITMKLWRDESVLSATSSCVGNAATDAAAVCAKLGIEHHILDFTEDFLREVVRPFADEYFDLQIPNPCVWCNGRVKWGLMAQRALSELNCDAFATGHYANIAEFDGRRFLIRGDAQKDQSYFLWDLPADLLQRTLFPLAEYSKPEIRQIASDLDLPVKNKAESQDICFIPDNDKNRFLTDFRSSEMATEDSQKSAAAQEGPLNKTSVPGEIVTEDGTVVGEHQGLEYYTPGQRKGLGIALGYPAFVLRRNPLKNQLVVGPESGLWTDSFVCADANWFVDDVEDFQKKGIDNSKGQDGYNEHGELDCANDIQVQIRFRAEPVSCILGFDENGLVLVRTTKLVRSVTAGQSAVFFLQNRVIGGAIIRN